MANTNAPLIGLDYKAFFDKAVSYEVYQKNFEAELLEESSPYAQYLPQNWRRQSRLDRKLKLRDDLAAVIKNLGEEQERKWLLITEHWCGDASQINPIINKVAEESNGIIDLRFIYRDDNHELIDAHLTDGRSRSIPILIELNNEYEVMQTYGPRPEEAQQLVKRLLANGEGYSVPLHSWYAKDKQQSIQDDMVKFLKRE